MFFFDPVYFLFLLPALLLAGYAQLRVKSTFAEARNIPARSGRTGAQTAATILNRAGLSGMRIELSQGTLSDHYDPRERVLRLSPEVYHGRSLAALGVAAHEAGHALQDARHYAPLKARNAIVPLAGFGSGASWIFMLLGVLLNSLHVVGFGIFLFSLVVVFQLVNLPVEFDASARAKAVLVQDGHIGRDELPAVESVLNAAALTYVAATLTAILTLLYYLFRFGLLGGRQSD